MIETKELVLYEYEVSYYERYGWINTSETSKTYEHHWDSSTSYSGTVDSSGKVTVTKHFTPGGTTSWTETTYYFKRKYESKRHKRWLHFYEFIHSLFFLHSWIHFVLATLLLIIFGIISNRVSSPQLFTNPDIPHSGIPQLVFIGLMIALGLSAYGGYTIALRKLLHLPTLLLTLLTFPIRLIALKAFSKNKR